MTSFLHIMQPLQRCNQEAEFCVQDKPKPPMKCYEIGKAFEPKPGADKWILRKDHSVEVLYDEFQTIAEGGWRNKVVSYLLHVSPCRPLRARLCKRQLGCLC